MQGEQLRGPFLLQDAQSRAVEDHPRLEPGQRSTDAEMRSAAEAHVPLGMAPVEAQRVRLLEDFRVAIRGGPHQHEAIPGLERVAAELVTDVAADGTRYAEIRWAPSLHTVRGLSLADGIAAVARGAGRTAAREGVVVRLIAVALRTQSTEVADEVASASLAFLQDGLTGFDIAGQGLL